MLNDFIIVICNKFLIDIDTQILYKLTISVAKDRRNISSY